MKKVISLLAVLAFFGSMANAELLKNFKYDGKLEVNGYNINNAKDFDSDKSDKYGDVDTRLMLNMGFDLNDDANAVVTIVKDNRKDNRQWGTESENANGIQDNLFFDQAYLNLKGVIGMDHKLGRQFYGNTGDLVIYYGPKMWPYQIKFGNVSAIDAWVGTYNYKDWTFTSIMGKEKRVNDEMGKNISGIDVKTKIDRFNLNAYYYYRVDNSTVDMLGLLGFRANWDCKYVEGLHIGGEYDHNNGSKNRGEYKGYAWKVNAEYKRDLAGKLGLKAEYAYLSGEKDGSDVKLYTPIATDYRPGIILNGFNLKETNYSDIDNKIGTGRKYFISGINWTPEKLNKLNIAFDYINAKVAEENVNMDDTIGNEYDIVATWNHSDNVSVKGYYAMFKPEKHNVSDTPKTDDMTTALGAAFVVKF
jgi:hypothetical protein